MNKIQLMFRNFENMFVILYRSESLRKDKVSRFENFQSPIRRATYFRCHNICFKIYLLHMNRSYKTLQHIFIIIGK